MTTIEPIAMAPAGSFLTDPGGKRTSPLSYLAGFLGAAVVAFALIAVTAFGMMVTLLSTGLIGPTGSAPADLEAAITGHWPTMMTFVALQYASVAFALFLAVKFWHGRGALSVLTGAGRFRWRRFAYGVGAFGAIHLGLFAVALPFDGGIGFNAPPLGTVLALVAVSIPVLFLQTATEEAVARGYLMQLLGSFRLPGIAILTLSSLIFAAAHLGNPEMASDPTVFVGYFTIGFVFAWIAMREGGLELAAGGHFINNMFASVIVRSEDSVFQTPSLFITPAFSDYSALENLVSTLSAPILFLLAVKFLVPRAAD